MSEEEEEEEAEEEEEPSSAQSVAIEIPYVICLTQFTLNYITLIKTISYTVLEKVYEEKKVQDKSGDQT